MREEDISRFKAWFEKYTDGFRVPGIGKDVEMKVRHTLRVVEEIAFLGEDLGLSGGELRLARAVALFHDVGRFPQVKEYGTFNDARSVDHAALGVEVLLEEGLLTSLDEEEREAIKVAVRHHNLLRLPRGLSEKALFYSRLIRDADKLDIWRVVLDYYENGSQERDQKIELEVPDTPGFSERVIRDLKAKKVPHVRFVENFNDAKLLQMSWAFDLNFPATCEAVIQRRYMERLAKQLPEDVEVSEALGTVLDHLADRIGQRP